MSICIKDLVDKYSSRIISKNNTIGSILKHYRKEHDLTLEETVGDACSVSYLCKVEKDEIIPSDKILREIIKRLKINEEVFSEISDDKDTTYIDKILEHGLVPSYILEDYISKNDYKSKLINFAYEIFNKKNFNDAIKLNNTLKGYINFFNDDEMAFYIYIVMYVNYKREQYEGVILNFKVSESIFKNENLIVKSNVLIYKSLYRLGRFGEAESFYKDFQPLLYRNNRINDLNKLKQYELSVFARNHSQEEILKVLKYNMRNPEISIDFTWFNYYYHLEENYEKALFHIRKIRHLKEHYHVCYLITLDKLNLVDELKKALNSDEFKCFKLSYNMVLKYLHVKNFENELFQKLKREIRRISTVTNEFFIIEYLYKEYIQFNKKSYLYKEAFEFSELLVSQYEQRLKTIIYN